MIFIKYRTFICKKSCLFFLSANIRIFLLEILSIYKRYLKLKAKITTVKKVTTAEELELLTKVYSAIYENFNCHKIDFSEEIPYETILEVIKNADTRIKDVSLDEPILYTSIMKVDNTEYPLVSAGTNTVED